MINGDHKLSWIHKLLYFIQCMKGWYFNSIIGAPSMRFINLKVIDQDTGSPSRRLCNMFWGTINWNNLAAQLGGKVKLFDVACGRGHYGLKYRDYLGKNFDDYTGLDIYKHVDFPKIFSHINDKAENVKDYIIDHNLIVSQSALEHIEHDIDVLVSSVDMQRLMGRPFLQIHLVPAASSLFLYLWHGWRQYSSNNLFFISKHLMSLGGVKTQVIPLGGWSVFISHFLNITIPTLVRVILNKPQVNNWDTKKSTLSSKITKSVLKNRLSTNKIPSFWAFIIYSEEIEIERLFD